MSMQRHCAIYLATDKKWYLELGDFHRDQGVAGRSGRLSQLSRMVDSVKCVSSVIRIYA